MASGIAGLDFINDIVKLILTKWKSSGGRKPSVGVKWNRKVINLGTNREETIIISLDGENSNIFSLRYSGGSGNPIYDWLHDIAVSIDIWTGLSEDRVLQMVNEVVRILKTNVLFSINNRQYVQLLPVGITPLLEDYRNIYRYMVDAEAMRFNP